MIETIYIEQAINQHPRVQKIKARFPHARIIECVRYGEVFNPKAQNFRLQKQKPALILAEKYNNYALPTPENYGIGATHNYYFSHMLNCLYDCRYCFLQGMYQSANYILFVNYEDFQKQIDELCQTHHHHQQQPVHFFSGYDCDSLALEPVTDFVLEFLPFFDTLPNAWVELRTKSTQIRNLLNQQPIDRCIVAYSLSPDTIAQKLEHKAPSLQKRIDAMVKLQAQGWLIGLRFDPLIFQNDFEQQYQRLFEQVFSVLDERLIHSVSYGNFRLPEKYFKKIHKLYPKEKLFAGPLALKQSMYSYQHELEQQMLQLCHDLLTSYIPQQKLFPCQI